MRHLCSVKPLNRLAMKTQIPFLTLIIFSCIVEVQGISVSDKLVFFRDKFSFGGMKAKSDKIKVIAPRSL